MVAPHLKSATNPARQRMGNFVWFVAGIILGCSLSSILPSNFGESGILEIKEGMINQAVANPMPLISTNLASQQHFLEILTAQGSKQGHPQEHLPTFCELLKNGFSYNTKLPTVQAAADILSPWHSKLPDTPTGETLDIGSIGLFRDDRVGFLLGRVNIRGKHVLELGPLEGGHSYMLSKAGATVTGIEGSPLGYLKNLLIKDVYELNGYKPTFGNFVAALEVAAANHAHFDAVLAVGVLYHMTEPMKLLHLISQVTDVILIWTHFYNANRAKIDPGRSFDPNPAMVVEGGFPHTPHCFQYVTRKKDFIGGQEGGACLLDRTDLMGALKTWGYQIDVYQETVDTHPGGPEITFLARRT
jgi:2-polyprenyl-3-methyl-5-hydroxy-6-metoxy-1,4-benzoquinol methylase